MARPWTEIQVLFFGYLMTSARNLDPQKLPSRFLSISIDWVKWPSANLIWLFFMSAFVKVKSVSWISMLLLLIYWRKTNRNDRGSEYAYYPIQDFISNIILFGLIFLRAVNNWKQKKVLYSLKSVFQMQQTLNYWKLVWHNIIWQVKT